MAYSPHDQVSFTGTLAYLPGLGAAWELVALQSFVPAVQEATMSLLHRRWCFRFLLVAAATFAGCASQPPAGAVERYITDRSREWTDAYVTGDVRVLEEIIAEDFVGTSTKGVRYTKQKVIQDAKGGYFLSNRLSTIDVRVLGTTALAFGVDVMVLKGKPAVEEIAAWTDTWLLRNGRWQVVASHESTVSGAAGKSTSMLQRCRRP